MRKHKPTQAETMGLAGSQDPPTRCAAWCGVSELLDREGGETGSVRQLYKDARNKSPFKPEHKY